METLRHDVIREIEKKSKDFWFNPLSIWIQILCHHASLCDRDKNMKCAMNFRFIL